MPTKKPNVINWRNGLIIPRQANEIEKIEKESDIELVYKGQSVREASAFILNYQETVKTKIKNDNSDEYSYPWLTAIGFTILISVLMIIDILL